MVHISRQKHLCLMVLFLLLFMYIGAQVKTVVKKSYAFYFETIHGNFPKGGINDIETIQNDSSPLIQKPAILIPAVKKDTSIVVFIETTTQSIQWETALQNKQQFIITVIPLKSFPFYAGFVKNGRELVISPAKGNYLFELQLLLPTAGLLSTQKITKDKIILKGKYKKKFFTIKTQLLKELIPLPAS